MTIDDIISDEILADHCKKLRRASDAVGPVIIGLTEEEKHALKVDREKKRLRKERVCRTK